MPYYTHCFTCGSERPGGSVQKYCDSECKAIRDRWVYHSRNRGEGHCEGCYAVCNYGPLCHDCQDRVQKSNNRLEILAQMVEVVWKLRLRDRYENKIDFHGRHLATPPKSSQDRFVPRPAICATCGVYVECLDGVIGNNGWVRPALENGSGGASCDNWVKKELSAYASNIDRERVCNMYYQGSR